MKKTRDWEGRCAVCLRDGVTLMGDAARLRPIRHGFNAIGVRHGSYGGFHTGPCDGTRFPHFGLSADGAVYEQARTDKRIEGCRSEIARLLTRPPLPWSFTERVRSPRPGAALVTLTFTLTADGDSSSRREFFKSAAGYESNCYVPSYDEYRASLITAQEHDLEVLEAWRATLVAAIAAWAPADPTPRRTEVPVVHRAREHKIAARGGGFVTIQGPACRRIRYQSDADRALVTADPSKITCRRCG